LPKFLTLRLEANDKYRILMVTLNLEEDEIFFLLACLEEISGLVSSPPKLLHQLQSKLAFHSNRIYGNDFSVDYEEPEVSSLILSCYYLISR